MIAKTYDLETIKDMQRRASAKPDGAFGRLTLKALAELARGLPPDMTYGEFCAWWDTLPSDAPLAPATLTPDLEPAPLERHRRGAPRPAHLQAKGRRGKDGARRYGLGEDPGGAGADRLVALPRWLDVEHSARYQRKPDATYCNIYATDFARACGIYLPRVWWRDPEGDTEQTDVVYGDTVRELSADALHDWLLHWGDKYGWRRYPGSNLADAPRWLQGILDAEPGQSIGVICGRVPGRGSGHITVALPQLPGYGRGAMVDSRGRVLAPLQSQAGSTNKQIFSKVWWEKDRFDSVILAHAEVRA